MVTEVDLVAEIRSQMRWLRNRDIGWDGEFMSYRHERGFGVELKLAHAIISIGVEYGTWILGIVIRHRDLNQIALPVGVVLSILQRGAGKKPTAVHVETRQDLATGLKRINELLDHFPGLLEANRSVYQNHERAMIEAP